MNVTMIESDLYYIIGGSAVGIISFIYILFGPNLHQTKGGNRKDVPISGLLNFGNNCFINSILQAVANSESMVTWLANSNLRIEANGKLIAKMNTLVTCINQRTLTWMSPREVITCLVDYEYGFLFSGGQQDAHELFNAITTTLEIEFRFYSTQHLLNGMLKDMSNFTKRPFTKQSINSAVIDLLNSKNRSATPLPSRGLVGNHLMCHNCHYKYPLNIEIFNVITLSLPTTSDSFYQPVITLEDCIGQFINTETIEDFNCESCSQRSTFDKKIEFIKLPQLLCFHIQRLVWLGDTMNSSQLKKRIERVIFPEILIMDPFTYTFKSSNVVSNVGEAQSLTSDEVSNKTRVQSSRYRFQVSSVIVHFGGDSSGHYICYRRLCDSSRGQFKWFSVSDKDVSEIDSRLVFSCAAYMIFYERISNGETL